MTDRYPLAKGERERLCREFYSTYDTQHWLHKIRTWEILLENSEEFIDEFGDEELEESGPAELEKTAKSEIVFTFYHISESLFMLMAASSSHLPWIRLKDIWVRDIEEFYEGTIKGGADPKDIRLLLYPDLEETEETKGTIDESVKFVQKYLSHMGEWFFDREIYNEYKHGLRLSTTESSIRLAPEREDDDISEEEVFERGGLSHVYLEREEIDVDESANWYEINKVTSGFDYEMFLTMCRINYLIIKQMIEVREKLFERESADEREVEVTSFHEYDISEVFDYDHNKNWEFKVSYQTGDEVITVD